MAKHQQRHARARMIRAAQADLKTIHADAVGIDWVQAADGEATGKPAGPKRFSMVAYTGGPMQVSAYGPPVVIDMAGLKAKAPVPILLNHDLSQIVGHADEVNIGESSLKLSGLVSGGGASATEVLASSANGFPWKASVGARPDKLEFVSEGVSTKVNGKMLTGPLYVARKATLGEVSFVAVGADSRTSAKVAATAAFSKESDMEFAEWLKAQGIDENDLRDDVKAYLTKVHAAEVKAAAKAAEIKGTAPEMKPPAFDLAGVILAHEKHVVAMGQAVAKHAAKVPTIKLAEIQAKASADALDLKAKALDEEWTKPRLEGEQMKAAGLLERDLILAGLPQGPGIQSSSADMPESVIEAAFCRSAGLRNLDKHFEPKTLEAADRHFRNFGLQEMILRAAACNGYTGRPVIHDGNLREVIRAAFSTHTIGTMLSTAGNKLLLDGFNSIPQTWRMVAASRSVSDFKTMTAFRMTAGLEYEEVGPAGEIKHGTAGQETYTYSAKTYAKMLALTRQDIINDDLGAFNDIRNRLGIGAAIKMNSLFWTTFLTASNAGVFWSAARANLVTSSALAEAGLNTAVKAFREMAGPDGNMMNLEPRFVLVPPALESTAKKLYVSQEMRDTTASTKFQTANIYQNMFVPIVVPELGNSSYTGYSATTWYLLTDPSVMACAVMCFLNGQESPTIESADADFDTLGIQFRGYHDFGAAMTEYRCCVKATA